MFGGGDASVGDVITLAEIAFCFMTERVYGNASPRRGY